MSVDWYDPKQFRRQRNAPKNYAPRNPKKKEPCGPLVILLAIYGGSHLVYTVGIYLQKHDLINLLKSFFR